nr:esterase-like activity of phytase family protein [Xylophilus sp.]
MLAAAFWLSSCAPLPPAATPQPEAAAGLRLIGEAVLPHGLDYGGTTVGGLSGIDYDAAGDRYVLISDDRSDHQPARFYTARIRYDAASLEPPVLTGTAALRQPSGRPYAPARAAEDGVDVPDAEAVRWLPGGQALLWTTEGDHARGFDPALREARADGSFVRELPLPAHLGFSREPGRGARNNATLEGLAITPDGRTAWVAMEGPLRQDGPVATPASGGAPVRFTALDIASGRALRQIAYQPDAVPLASPVPGGHTNNGVAEILADGPDHLLVLERSYSLGAGTSLRLYRIDTRAGSDTLALDRLAPGNHRPAPKVLVANLATLGLRRLDNVEGMTWGPPLPGGARVLVFVSDNNFSRMQITQLFAAEYREPPPTASASASAP